MILISIFLGSLTMRCVYSISCYRCETTPSTIDNQCAYGPLYGDPEDCEGQLRLNIAAPQYAKYKPKDCLKVTGVDKYGNEYTGRGCIPYLGGDCAEVVKIIGFFAGVEGGVKNLKCYSCKTTECNSSFTVRSCLFTVLIISIATSVFKF